MTWFAVGRLCIGTPAPLITRNDILVHTDPE